MSVEGKTATQSGFSKFVQQAQQSLGPLLALIILCVIASIASQFFLSPRNILNVLRQSSINAIIAAGMTLTILTGGIDLSVGSVVALSSTTLGLLMIHHGQPSSIARLSPTGPAPTITTLASISAIRIPLVSGRIENAAPRPTR